MKQTKDNSELSVAVLNTRASFSGNKSENMPCILHHGETCLMKLSEVFGLHVSAMLVVPNIRILTVRHGLL